MDDSCVAV